jgi:hypothetical protein
MMRCSEKRERAGHGGACFGYRNIVINGADGQRSHAERAIDASQAEIIRQIFRLSAEGHGFKAIAKRLNDERALWAWAQRGRSQSWAPSSVRAVLFRPLYQGESVWSRTQKRDTWAAYIRPTVPNPVGSADRHQTFVLSARRNGTRHTRGGPRRGPFI